MVNSLNGITAADYQAYLKVQNTMLQAGTTNPVNLTYENDSVSFSGNQCTDGKDDGKIGFFSAVGNAIEGVGKTIVNGVKGMFTGKDGKFSLGKTLLSLGTAALCIAFPAVGVAACVVGGTMGAVQIGKGIYNAATATTDAEAKQAWEDIGGGAFTVGASVVGAKAGVKAVKTTAGPNSALASLDDAATMGQKAAALGKDMISSTKNQATSIKNSATAYVQKIGKSKVNVSDLKKTAKAKAGEIRSSVEDTIKNRSNYKKAKADYDTAAKAYDNATKNGWTDDAFAASDDLKFAQDKLLAAESKYKYSGYEQKINNAIHHPIKTAKNIWNTSKGKVKKENAEALWNGIKETYNKGIKNKSLTELGNKLTGTASRIWQELIDGKYSYPEVVNKYGFENVAEVIKYMGGTIYGGSAL